MTKKTSNNNLSSDLNNDPTRISLWDITPKGNMYQNNPIHSGTYRATYTPAYRIENPLNDKNFIESCIQDNLKHGKYDPKDIKQFQEIISGKYQKKLKNRLRRVKYIIRDFIAKYTARLRLF